MDLELGQQRGFGPVKWIKIVQLSDTGVHSLIKRIKFNNVNIE